MKILSSHTSPETAFEVSDYPYGFRLRCKIRYWLESSPNKGVRFMSQTSNPKRDNLVWNKPKASTYCKFGGCMYLNQENHVAWSGAHEYQDLQELLNWKETFYAGVPDDFKPILDGWLAKKIAFNHLKEKGLVSIVTTTTDPDGLVMQEKRVLEPEVIQEKVLIGGLIVKSMPSNPMTATELTDQCNLVSAVCNGEITESGER